MRYTFHNDFKEASIGNLFNTKQMYFCGTVITQQGLQRVAKSATIMGVEDIDDWFYEGDIPIVNRFVRTRLTEKLINTLHQKQISNVIIHKLCEEHITIEQKDLLMNYHAPLIFVEDNVPWHDMIALIQNLVINNQTQYLVESQSFRNSIINYLSKNYTLNSLCEIVHNLTQITITITDYNLQLQGSSNDNNWNTELYNPRVSALHRRILIGENFNDATVNGCRYQDTAINGEYQYFIVPSYISKFTSVFFIAIRYHPFAEILPPELIYRLETIESIYSLKNSITAEFEEPNYYFKSAVFENLLDISHEDRVRKKQIGLNPNTELSDSYYLFLTNSRKNLNILNNVGLLTGLISHLKYIRLYNNKSPVFLYKEQWIILISDKIPSVEAMGAQLYDTLPTYFNPSHFIMGISDLHHYWGLRRVFSEAAFTTNYAKNKQGNVRLLVCGESGIVKLLIDSSGNINDAYLDELYQSYLKPIVDYDKKYSSDLYLTLEYFFSNEFSYKITNGKLFIYVNTLHARIVEIGNLIHVSLPNLDSVIGSRPAILLNWFDYLSHYGQETL